MRKRPDRGTLPIRKEKRTTIVEIRAMRQMSKSVTREEIRAWRDVGRP